MKWVISLLVEGEESGAIPCSGKVGGCELFLQGIKVGEGLQTTHGCGVVLGTDHQHSILLCHDKSLETTYDSEMTAGQPNEVVGSIIEKSLAMQHDVFSAIGLDVRRRHGSVYPRCMERIGAQTLPSTQVSPSEVAALDVAVLGVLQEGILEREVWQGGVETGSLVRGGGGAEVGQFGEIITVLGHVLEDVAEHILCTEDKESCVPEEFTAFTEYRGEVQTGLLGKGLDTEDIWRAPRGFPYLNVAIARLGARGYDSEGDDSFVAAGYIEGMQDVCGKGIVVIDLLIGRCDDDACLWTDIGDGTGGPGYGCQRATAHGFCQHLAAWQLGQLLVQEGEVALLSGHIDVLRTDEGGKAVVGLLDEGPSAAYKIQILLGTFLATDGPKSAAYATCENQAKIVSRFVHGRRFCA